jgi:hypothetical protein
MADPSEKKVRRPSREAIEAVSDALRAGKTSLDRPPSPARIDLPEVARSIGDFARRSNGMATPILKPDGHSISPEAARIELPEGIVDGSKVVETPREEEIGHGTTEGGRRSGSVEAQVEPTPASRAIPSTSLGVRAAVARDEPPTAGQGGPAVESPASRGEGPIERTPEASGRPEEMTVPASRSSPMVDVPPASGSLHDLGGPREPEARPDPASIAGSTAHPASIPVGGVGGPSTRVDVSEKASAVGRLGVGEGLKPSTGSRNGEGASQASAAVARSSPMADSQSGSSMLARPSMSFVRNPLSSEFRNLSLSGPALQGQGGPASDRRGIEKGAGDPPSGGSSSSQDGAAVDLSRTNELLQQLIDAVRKQRGSSLPPGGPSVYPDR